MRIAVVADTHGAMPWIPPADILVHAGDLTAWGEPGQLALGLAWLEGLPHRVKVLIAGNHDRALLEVASGVMLPPYASILYLADEVASVCGLKIYGAPWSPPWGDFVFQYEHEEHARAIWAQIPTGLDLLVTHGGPFGILDQLPGGASAGCPYLLERVREVRPRWHLFGHIHEAGGLYEWADESVRFMNAAAPARWREQVIDL